MTAYDDDKPILGMVGRFWWMMACRGLIISVFGTLVLIDPHVTTMAFVIMFTVYVLVSGLIFLVLGFQSQQRPHRWTVFFLPAAVSLAVALMVAFLPWLAVLGLIGVVGTWSILLGLIEVLMAVQLRKMLVHKWALFLAGALSMFAGAALLIRPFYIVLFDFWRVGATALPLGLLIVLLAFQIRKVMDVSSVE